MAKKSGEGSIQFRFSNKGGANAIRQKIEDKFSQAKDEFVGKVKSNFGSGFVRDDMFESGIVFQNRKQMMKGAGDILGNTKARERIAEIYKEAWEERYEDIQTAHRKHSPPKTPHQKYKERRMDKPAYHTNRDVKYSEHTKWTGLMYESVMAAFKDGGNEHLSVSNLLITGGFQMHPDAYDDHYFSKFTPWFRKSGILQGDIIEFSGSHWERIIDQMKLFVHEGFVQPLVEVLNNLEMKV
jgi:hypothetical protein